MASDVDLVDPAKFPHRPIDNAWSLSSEARSMDLIARYHRSMRDSDESIASADEMWNGLGKGQPEWARLHYMYGGRSGLKCVIDALITADVPLPKAIFDFPSAHGRVTRFLKTAFPESELWAGDINVAGVDFCVDRFGAHPFYSAPDLATVSIPRKFDLIWCGSLASHLPEAQCKALFALLLGSLEDDGILCITTCGRGMQYAHENLFKTIHEPAYEKICADLKEHSFGFAPYSYHYAGYDSVDKYGMAFIYPAWIEKNILNPDIQVLQFREKAWHGAQDVWCLINRPTSSWYNWARS
ncbi:MAG: class I SAM-dependent methyltransferase [Bryobacteraceae bacterium]